MRFNVVSNGFRHPVFHHFHRKWDREVHRKNDWFKRWRRMYYARRNRPVTEIPVEIAPGYNVIDAVQLVKQEAEKEKWQDPYIWPYEKQYVKDTLEDPEYHKVKANYFSRKTVILEGFKGAMNFTNTILEGEDDMPQALVDLEETIEIDPGFVKNLEKRLKFAFEEDGIMHGLPKIRKFPALHEVPRKMYGIPVMRKEYNILNAFYDVALLSLSPSHGHIDRRRLNHPAVLIPYKRDGQLTIQDLTCDFVTLSRREADQYVIPAGQPAKPYADPIQTVDRNVVSIYPCNWEICFDKRHKYPTDYQYKIPPKDQIHTIYMTLNYQWFKKFPDRFYKARALMFCYGYGVAQYRNWYGNLENFEDHINYKVLEQPILLNSVFVNLSKNSIGFCNFQLNTTSFDSDVKNQVWFNGPFDINQDKERILKKIMAINLYGPYNQPALMFNQSTSNLAQNDVNKTQAQN